MLPLVSRPAALRLALGALLLLPAACQRGAKQGAAAYERKETLKLITLVDDAAKLVQRKGEGGLPYLRVPGSRFRRGDTYVFVLDREGNMLVHLDPAMEGKNQLGLKDVNGKPIVEGLLHAATAVPGKPWGFYHYEWPVPGGLLPRWKTSYVRLVTAPSGKQYVVGSGIYDDRMERAFVADLVNDAVGQIEAEGEAAFARFRDPTGPFMAKDAYVFVIEPGGSELVNPAFPNLERRNVLDVKDTQGKPFVREMFEVVRTKGAGWVDYMWPKPGDSFSTRKSTYVAKARLGGGWVLVGSGVYLADAPREQPAVRKVTAPELAALVQDASEQLQQRGEAFFPELRAKGSRWFSDDTYFIVVGMDGTRALHAADPTLEGKSIVPMKDVRGRPYGRMFLDVAASPSGEGWVHYMYPEPGSLFPAWKSTFVKRVTFPSGQPYLVACGSYGMQLDATLVQDLVDRAAALVAQQGRAAFPLLRDKTGPFVFMDTYVFVDAPDGIELVNAAQPSLEGKDLSDLRDVNGKLLAKEYIGAALRDGSAWVDYAWYKPGHNTPARKRAFVRKVQAGPETFVVGSGFYSE